MIKGLNMIASSVIIQRNREKCSDWNEYIDVHVVRVSCVLVRTRKCRRFSR